MSSRIRNSNARPTVARPSAAATPNRTTANELPPYKKPSHPLNAEAARELRALQGDSAKQVKKHNDQAVEVIRSAAEGVNDMLRDHSEYLNRRQKKWDAGRNLDDKEDEERRMQDLSEQVDEATAKLEESMRAIIDNGMAAQRMDETLEWVQQNAPRQLQEEYQTQMTQRATQRQTQAENQDADGDEDMEDAPTPGPTPLDGSRVTLTGVSELFSTRQERQKDIYTSLSLTARYARNNHYRDFKRIVHDAKFAEEGPALGDEETWFTEAGLPAPGITNTQRGDFDDGDDIVMNKAKISTRCPITFQEYKEPYTSIKCPHTFEKVAIIEMIRAQRGGIECPIPGCSKVSHCDHEP
jgi:hypothetical protein